MSGTQGFDVIVIGGGIAGASAACFLSDHLRVLVLEMEPTLGFHTTGRSVAQYLENYGGPICRRLTLASRDYFEHPPAEDVEVPLLSPRPLLTVGGRDDLAALASVERAGKELLPAIRQVSTDEALRMCPVLRPEWLAGAVLEPDAMDIDVMALHQGFIRRVRRAGGTIRASARVSSIVAAGQGWVVSTEDGSFEAAVLVNAAGAWADQIGQLAGAVPLGLMPLRRTAFVVPCHQSTTGWPFIYSVDEAFYFKPEADATLVCSPVDETLSEPCDARPETIDIARAIDAINTATTLDVRHVSHSWAGLRSFVPDRNPVVGFDEKKAGLFWLAGMGGTGIHTAPALGQAAAGLIIEGRLPAAMTDLGLRPEDLSPMRCQKAAV